MKKISKWLIQFDLNKELQITEEEVSQYAPINQILDRFGSFTLKVIDVLDNRYMIVYKSEEEYSDKTKILVAKIDSVENIVVDMANNDLANVTEIAKMLMGYHPVK